MLSSNVADSQHDKSSHLSPIGNVVGGGGGGEGVSSISTMGLDPNRPLPNHTSAQHFLNLNHHQPHQHVPQHHGPVGAGGPVFKALHPRRSIFFFIKIVLYISLLIFFLNIILYFFSTSERQEFERDIRSSFEHLEQPHVQLQESINRDLSESKEKLSLLRKNTPRSTNPTALSKIKGVFFGGLSGHAKSAFPLLNRYSPPRVPAIMETFTSDKRLVSSPETDHSPYSASISTGPQKAEQGFYIDKEKEINTRIDVSSISKLTLSIISQMFESKETCIRNDIDMATKKTNTLYNSCRFENICLNRKGEWILFTNKQIETTERPWVYTSSVYNEEFVYPKFKIKIAEPPKAVLYKGTDNHSEEKLHQATVTLSKNFKWIATPTFGFCRHSAGEVGSLILENYLPLFNQMADFEFVNYNNNILFLDDIHNEVTGKFARGEAEAATFAEDISNEFASFVSSNPPLQVCANDEKGMFVDFAPCKQEQGKPLEKEAEELDTCFSSLVVGSPDSYFIEPEKRHHLIPIFRDFVLNGMGYVPPRSYFEGRKKILIIGILNTSKSKKKETIVNADKLSDYLSGLSKDILQQVNSYRIPDDRYDSIRILNLKLDEMTLVQQIRLFSVMDVFITNQGMDSYFSLFMHNPRALVLYAPMCFSDTLQCSDYNLRVLHTYSNLKVVSLIDHLTLIECVKETSENAKGSPVKAMNEPPKSLVGDCNIRLNPSGMYLLIIKSLQKL